MSGQVSFEVLRARAFGVADTGRFPRWEDIGAAMESEGFDLATGRLGYDPILKSSLNARCDQAKDRLGS